MTLPLRLGDIILLSFWRYTHINLYQCTVTITLQSNINLSDGMCNGRRKSNHSRFKYMCDRVLPHPPLPPPPPPPPPSPHPIQMYFFREERI